MKYVILKQVHEDMGFTRVYPIIFPEHMAHSVVAMGTAFAYIKEEKLELSLLSAGFCWTQPNGMWQCETGSQSLKVERHSYESDVSVRDTDILNMVDALNGIVQGII